MKRNVLNKNILLIIICFIILTGYTFFVSYNKKLLGVFFIISMILYKINIKKIDNVSKKILLFYFIWILISIISVIFSSDMYQSFKMACVIIFSFPLLVIKWEEENISLFLKISRIICLIISISIMIEVVYSDIIVTILKIIAPNRLITVEKEFLSGIYSGIIGEKASAAYYMIIGIIIEIAFYIKNKKINFIIIMLYLISIILTGKRTLSLIIVLEVLQFFLISKLKNKKKIIFYLIILACIFLIISFKYIPASQILIKRMLEGLKDPTSGGRKVFWDYSLRMFKEKTLFGYGLNTFNTVFNNNVYFIFKGNHIIWTTHAHNIYLQLLAETGIIGFVSYISLMIYSYIGTLRLYKNNNLNNLWRSVLWISSGIQLLFILYGFTGNGLYYTTEYVFYIFSLGLYVNCNLQTLNEKRKRIGNIKF